METPDKIYVRGFSDVQRLLQGIEENAFGIALTERKTHEEIPYIRRESIIKTIMDERETCIQPDIMTNLLDKISRL